MSIKTRIHGALGETIQLSADADAIIENIIELGGNCPCSSAKRPCPCYMWKMVYDGSIECCACGLYERKHDVV